MRSLIPLLIGFLGCSTQGWASSAFIPELAYQARSLTSVPQANPASSISRLEQLVALPAPVALAVPAPVVAVEEHKDVWARIRKGLAMPQLTGKLVEQQQVALLRRADVLKSIVQRSRPYLYHVVNELQRRGFPMELALLPIVESGYNPHAISSAQALGLWQFIPQTGKKYALAQTEAYDGRRDIVASTRAAMDYLQFLYDLHKDWHLALASYNWGEESVLAAMERNKAKGRPTTYEALTLPEETRLYVPKLQALRNIIADPEAFGIELEPLPNEPYFVTVELTRGLDVKTAARLAGMSLDDFIALNPGFSGSVMMPRQNTGILVPADRAEAFRQNLANLPPVPAPKGRVRGIVGASASLGSAAQN